YAVAGDFWVADMESGFRPIPDHEYWEADVAVISRERWDGIPGEGNLQGPPELVVEVISPSNTLVEISRKKKLCLENGAREFWVVDKKKRKIEVSTADGRTVTYTSGQPIPLFFSSGATISVQSN